MTRGRGPKPAITGVREQMRPAGRAPYTEDDLSALQILLVEDNPGDVELTREGLGRGALAHDLHVASDGAEALEFLRPAGGRPPKGRPDLILLDLNLPRVDGREVLAEIKRDPELRRIPVVILTSSDASQDVEATYELQANCYIRKPVDFEGFVNTVQAIEDFWFGVACIPQAGRT